MTSGVFGLTDEPAPSAPIAVSRLEFDVLWESLALGEMPLVLKVPSPGRTTTERRRLVEDAWRAMENRGFARSATEYERLADLVRQLARPQREIDGRLWFGRKVGSIRVLAGASGANAVLATLTTDGLTLREAAPNGLAREALSALPPLPAGPGESVTVPSRQLAAAAENAATPTEFEAALRENGIRDRDAAILATMMMRLRRHGQFGAANRDRWGHRTRAQRVLSVFDTRAGRYLQTRSAAEPDAEPWTTVSPADQRLLTSQLDELLTN
jgi:hypothetical protein